MSTEQTSLAELLKQGREQATAARNTTKTPLRKRALWIGVFITSLYFVPNLVSWIGTKWEEHEKKVAAKEAATAAATKKPDGPPEVVVTPIVAEPPPTRYTMVVNSENWYTVEWPAERCYHLTNGSPETEREDLAIEVRGGNDDKWIDHWEYVKRRHGMSGWVPAWLRFKAKEGKDGEKREQTISLEFRRVGTCGT